jgi:hypothetical protein
MFSKLAIFATLALPVFAAATPAAVVARGGSSGSATTACCASTEPVRYFFIGVNLSCLLTMFCRRTRLQALLCSA